MPLLTHTAQRLRFAFAALVMGWLLSLAVPPMSSPDEMDHVSRGAMLAQGQILLHVPGPPAIGTPDDARYHSQSGGMVDWALIAYYHKLFTVLKDPRAKMTDDVVKDVRALRWEGREGFFATPGTGYYFPLIYLPHAVGIGLGKILGLSVHESYVLMRLTVLLASVAALTYALSLGRPSLPAIALMLTPMSLFQFVSPVLDGVTNALALLTLMLTLTALERPEETSRHRLGILGLCVFLLVSCRPQLAPLLLLLLYLAFRRRSLGLTCYGFGVAAASAAWLFFAMRQTVDLRLQRKLTTKESALHYLNHPGDLLDVVSETFTNADVLVFYWKSAIGMLGWLDAPMAAPPYYWVLSAVLCLALASCLPVTTFRGALSARALLVLIALSTLALTFFALLLTWTAVPAKTIEGVQGRYFIIPLLFLSAALTNWSGRSVLDSRPADRAVLVTTCVATSALGFLTALLQRYQ